jgi:ApaG protein
MYSTTSAAVTSRVRVQVESRYQPDHSAPARQEWLFTYTIRITNERSDRVQLVSRHWIITDETGRVEEVRGPGVVGKHPILKPGESFQYSSFVTLSTPNGVMHGAYQMIAEDGTPFEIEIAPFALREPYTIH